MTELTPCFSEKFTTPIGVMLAHACPDFLHGLYFEGHPFAASNILDGVENLSGAPILSQLKEELGAYFSKEKRSFSVPLYTGQGTDFQQKAWAALLTIPYGETRTYKEQATLLGRPTVVRAVGNANASNPFPILIPCHRVVRSSGSIGGYAGGVTRKEWLLAHEEGVLP